MTGRDWLKTAAERLSEAGIDGAASDAWLLYEHVTERSRLEYSLDPLAPLTADDQEKLAALLAKRLERIPLQQLLGEAWFYGYRFFVNEHVLTPRSDTEVLVEAALERVKKLQGTLPEEDLSILDLCTGSGCILLTVLAESENCRGRGTDISPEALSVAEKNVEQFRVNAVFSQSDIFDKIEERYHMILSNPPYIVRDVIPTLEPEVREHEPMLALDGGEDGLDFYRRIVKEAPDHLLPGGWLIFEIGYDQGPALKQLLTGGGFEQVEILQDLAGMDRVALGRWPLR